MFNLFKNRKEEYSNETVDGDIIILASRLNDSSDDKAIVNALLNRLTSGKLFDEGRGIEWYSKEKLVECVEKISASKVLRSHDNVAEKILSVFKEDIERRDSENKNSIDLCERFMNFLKSYSDGKVNNELTLTDRIAIPQRFQETFCRALAYSNVEVKDIDKLSVEDMSDLTRSLREYKERAESTRGCLFREAVYKIIGLIASIQSKSLEKDYRWLQDKRFVEQLELIVNRFKDSNLAYESYFLEPLELSAKKGDTITGQDVYVIYSCCKCLEDAYFRNENVQDRLNITKYCGEFLANSKLVEDNSEGDFLGFYLELSKLSFCEVAEKLYSKLENMEYIPLDYCRVLYDKVNNIDNDKSDVSKVEFFLNQAKNNISCMIYKEFVYFMEMYKFQKTRNKSNQSFLGKLSNIVKDIEKKRFVGGKDLEILRKCSETSNNITEEDEKSIMKLCKSLNIIYTSEEEKLACISVIESCARFLENAKITRVEGTEAYNRNYRDLCEMSYLEMLKSLEIAMEGLENLNLDYLRALIYKTKRTTIVSSEEVKEIEEELKTLDKLSDYDSLTNQIRKYVSEYINISKRKQSNKENKLDKYSKDELIKILGGLTKQTLQLIRDKKDMSLIEKNVLAMDCVVNKLKDKQDGIIKSF